MGKYIIEMDIEYAGNFFRGEELVLPVELYKGGRYWIETGIPLTPYTEPDTESIRKEAYEQGYTDGCKKHEVEIHAIAYANGNQDGYQKGLNDAWDAARKITGSVMDGCFNYNELNVLFGSKYPESIINKYSAFEAIEKIRQYEREKEEIKIGDEVEDGVANLVVTEINSDGTVSGIAADGSILSASVKRKTGRHFPEIAEVMQKMKEN